MVMLAHSILRNLGSLFTFLRRTHVIVESTTLLLVNMRTPQGLVLTVIHIFLGSRPYFSAFVRFPVIHNFSIFSARRMNHF
jgi:hypothetical protein